MTYLRKSLAAGAMIAIGVAIGSTVRAQQPQTTPPQISPMGPGMQQGGMMNMQQMSRMMEECHQMMQRHMQNPAGQSPTPEKPDQKR
jgi:hypothetical protein